MNTNVALLVALLLAPLAALVAATRFTYECVVSPPLRF